MIFLVGGEHMSSLATHSETFDLEKHKWSFLYTIPDVESSLPIRNLEAEQEMNRLCEPAFVTDCPCDTTDVQGHATQDPQICSTVMRPTYQVSV